MPIIKATASIGALFALGAFASLFLASHLSSGKIAYSDEAIRAVQSHFLKEGIDIKGIGPWHAHLAGHVWEVWCTCPHDQCFFGAKIDGPTGKLLEERIRVE